MALLDVRLIRRPAASLLAKLVTILISDFFQTPDDAVRTIRVSDCLLALCYEPVTVALFTVVQYAGGDSTPDRSGPAPTIGACSKGPRFPEGGRKVGWFDGGHYQQELFERHSKLAKAA